MSPSVPHRRLFGFLTAAVLVFGALTTAAPAVSATTTATATATAINTHPSYNGLSLTPPMGFNDWAGFECDSAMNETLFTKTADEMVSLGLNKLGYDYVNIDDCWMQKTRDAQGNLQVDATRFPHGLKWLGDYIHGKGLKFGIYEDAGYYTCQGAAGSYGHFQQDADLYASWGVDYLKLDYCYQPMDQFPGKTASQVAQIVYTEASQALLNTHRPMQFSESAPAYVCCSGPDFTDELTWLYQHGNLWRFGSDIYDAWPSVLENYSEDNTPGLAQRAGPGHWNDADMLEVGNGGLSPTEEQTQMTLWAEMASPILLSTDLAKLTPAEVGIVANPDVVAVDQDRLAPPGLSGPGGAFRDRRPGAGPPLRLRLPPPLPPRPRPGPPPDRLRLLRPSEPPQGLPSPAVPPAPALLVSPDTFPQRDITIYRKKLSSAMVTPWWTSASWHASAASLPPRSRAP